MARGIHGGWLNFAVTTCIVELDYNVLEQAEVMMMVMCEHEFNE